MDSVILAKTKNVESTFGSEGKASAYNAGDSDSIRIQSQGREDTLEKEMAPHSSILAQRIPWTEEPRRLQSMGL